MTRFNCHSAFKHYEMFHSRGCCGDSFGSVFNTTYNINTNGWGGGNFWSGFGLGLGNAFGGMFSGLFGGGMNMFGGNMFGGGMFGNYGMPWGGGFGNYGLYGGGGSSPSSSRTSADDPDCKVIADMEEKSNALPDDADKDKIDALIKEIDDAIDKLDPNNYADQKRSLNAIKARLIKRLPKDKKTENPSDNKVDLKKKSDTPNGGNVEKTGDGSTPNSTEAQKHAKEYLEGYSNVKESELDSLKDKFELEEVIDTSDIDDFTSDKIKSKLLAKTGNKWQIKITLNGGTVVTYDFDKTIDGELVFICSSHKGNQQYILQRDKSNKLHLMQYKHNPGYGVGCVSITTRK